MLRALARVQRGAIERNCARLKGLVGERTHLCAVVKADGYGHGAATAARAALAGGATWLAVATAEEAAALREAGLPSPVLVMGALSEPELAVAAAARADVVAWREGFVERAAAQAAAAGVALGVHVKLDTGMGRLGTRDADEALAVVERVEGDPRLRLVGAMTHFATADEADPAFLHEQLARFAPWVARVRAAAAGRVLAHAANSAATLRLPAAHLDLVRCGVAIYGLDPFQRDPADHGLEPALELRSYVADVKRVAPGESVGYGRRFVARAERSIATIPIGYGDGVRRGLADAVAVRVAGRLVPLVGRISMDHVTADLGPDAAWAAAARGRSATLIGPGLPAEGWARALDTINYEVTCGIGPRVPRAPW